MTTDWSYGHSATVLIRATASNWKLAVTGLTATVAGWLLPALGLSASSGALAVAGLALLGVAGFRAFHDLRVERDELRETVDRRKQNQETAIRLLKFLETGTHEIANMMVDPHDLEETEKLRLAEYHWLSDVRAAMLDCGCPPQELSAVTDFTSADIPDPATIGYCFPKAPHIAVRKAMFAMRLKNLKKVINLYSEDPVL